MTINAAPFLRPGRRRPGAGRPGRPAALDPVQHLIDAGPLGQPPQLAGQELLQRLAAPLGPALQGGVDVVRNIRTSKFGMLTCHCYQSGAVAMPTCDGAGSHRGLSGSASLKGQVGERADAGGVGGGCLGKSERPSRAGRPLAT